MSVELHDIGKALGVKVSGKLTKADYEHFVPEVERRIERDGKVDLLFEMHDFHGWELGALWEDTKFDVKHFRDIGKLAMVGEKKWQAGMAQFCRPFTTAKVRYFDVSDADSARAWLESEG